MGSSETFADCGVLLFFSYFSKMSFLGFFYICALLLKGVQYELSHVNSNS